MKYKVKRRIEGSVSVMMVIILLVTMVFSALIVDTSRINMARSMVSSAGDLAVNSALANYDTVLKDVYGLFAMSQAQTSEELNQEIREYFEKTLVSYGVTSEAEAGDYVSELMSGVSDLLSGTGSMEVSNFLDMEMASDFAVTKVAASGLDNPEILRKQIVDYMKYRAPMNFGLSFLDSVKAFTTINDQTKVVQAQVEAQESLQPVTQGCRTVIDSIRAYDSRVQAIDTGDQAVVGKDSSTDPTTVGIRQYHEQLDKYRQDWGENYENINRLTLIFLLKPPTVSDRYLCDMSIAANEHFIHDDTLEVDKSGITVEVELAETCEAAESQVVAQREKLSKEEEGSCLNLQQTYCNADFLPEGSINYYHTDYTVQKDAINAFIRYEAFLLNDADKVPITYSKAAEILEQLCILEKYQDNYVTLMERDITEQAAERDAKAEEMNYKLQEVEEAKNELSNAENAKKDVETKKSAWESAITVSNTAQTKIAAAEKDLNSYTGKKNTEKYRSLEAALEAAKTNYNEAKTAEENAKAAYDSAKAAEPSDEQIRNLHKVKSDKEAEYGALNDEYRALKDKVDNLEAQKNNHISKYKEVIDAYEMFANAYQWDQEWYVTYQEIARGVVNREATAIQTQALKIQENVKMLKEDLDLIEEKLNNLSDYVKEYDDMVEAWKGENDNYTKSNSTDTFSKQNEADIAATESQYNLDSLNELLSYVQSLKQIYDDFYKYITDSSHYKYGSKRVDTMSTYEQILSAIPVEVKDALPEIVTDDDAQRQLNTLYPEEHTPKLDIKKATFLIDGVLPIQFLKYLNENFPVEEQKITLDNQGEDPEQQYKDIKTQMKEEKGVDEEIPENEGDPYGYTFREHPIKNPDILPSHKQDLDGSNITNESNTTSMSITEDKDGNVNASNSLKEQNKGLNSALGDVGRVLETGLENVYIMDYIFENFSYNTMIQEMMVKDVGMENYSEVMRIAADKRLANYVGTARTLSNYSITGASNYLYGAEVEYILWGNVEPAKNVTFTKGSIYAIRFAFNSIFAFTNSEIRNMTRTVGLAVQAATAGFVPYQVVQVVLQLALAAAESAIDLDMMSKGLKVVVVKTKDTWSMSVSGAVGFMKSAAVGVLENTVETAIDNAISHVDEGINAVLDASAEELGGAIEGLTDTLNNAAQSKGQEIVDSIYTKLQSEIDNLLNDLQFTDYATLDGVMTKGEIEAQVDDLFETLKNKVEDMIAGYEGDPIADEILRSVRTGITGSGGVIEVLQRRIHSEIDKSYADTSGSLDVGSAICGAMTQIRCDIIGIMQDKLKVIEEEINSAAEKSIAKVTDDLKKYKEEYLDQLGEDLTEKAVTEVKDKVVGYLDDFTDTYLRDIEKPNLGSGGIEDMSSSSNVASMIKFGYKDYLMLMLFISMCVSDTVVLERISDLIQLNMQNATGQADQEGQLVFCHSQKDTFTMAEARTYVTVQGSVRVDMLFLDMDFFNRLLVEEGTDIQEQVSSVATIPYNGIAGY